MKYGAYLVRYWGEESQVRRVEVVHVQTGERVLLSSMEEAIAWIDGRNETTGIQNHGVPGFP